MVRIRWSDLEQYKPVQIVWQDFSQARFWHKNHYVLMESSFQFMNGKERSFELCVPYAPLARAIVRLPLSQQLLLKGRSPCELTLVKVKRGGMVIKDVKELGDDKNG